MDTFQHIPLDPSKECIRLLRFVEQPPSSELNHFALETYDVGTAPRFVALSYTWGCPEPTHDILVNGSLLPVRENLWVALKILHSFFSNKESFLGKQWLQDRIKRRTKYLLQEVGHPLMWIDALCIKQSDLLEKSHQVNMMGRIFSMAGYVISWLGDEADNSRCVMRAIRTAKHTRQCASEVKQAMNAFVERPYWNRMWVVQEFVLSQDLIILCGHEAVGWEDLFHFWCHENVVCDVDGDDRLLSGKSVQSVSQGGLATLISTRCSRRAECIEIFPIHSSMTGFAYGECTDPRDRIYALLALIKPRVGVEPLLADYDTSAEDLYYRVLAYVGPVKQSRYWRNFRKELREALDISSWAGADAVELHEIVYEVVGMEYSHQKSFEFTPTKEERGLFTRIQDCLAKHLEQPVGGMFREGDWIYHDTIRHFESFPRGEDPRTWQRFDNLLLRWLHILPAGGNSIFQDDLSDCELGLCA